MKLSFLSVYGLKGCILAFGDRVRNFEKWTSVVLRAVWRRVRRLWSTTLGVGALGRNEAGAQSLQQLDQYVTGARCAQNAVDALAGWNHALPPQAGAEAGSGFFYHDGRILWALQQFGSLSGKSVLEIGPLEASHTYLIENHGPALLHAVEANRLSFLRCLVVKELLQLKIARFFLGDCQAWLEESTQRYDFIIASGVLYHMMNPVRFIELMSARTDAIFLWTHYADETQMPKGDPRRSAFIGDMETEVHHGIPVRSHRRSYHGAWVDKSFCGGIHDMHRWLERDDILALLSALGFDDVRVWSEEPDHPNGPAFCVFAQRRSSVAPPDPDEAGPA